MIVRGLSESIANIIQDICARREQIKEDYVKAWLATTIPEGCATPEWIITNCELQERWSNDRKTVTWRMVLKPEQGEG